VSDELAARVRSHLSDAEFVELAAWVALENFRSRFNAGLGLKSQGFADHCDIPRKGAAVA
jgi:alkylhydroperoxidase family enzyme